MLKWSEMKSVSRVRLFATPWIAARQDSLSITNSWSSLRLMSIDQWCHPAISSSVVPFSSCPQSLPAAESFPMSQLFTWGGQRTGVSALVSFLPKKSQGWSPSEWTLFLYKYITVYSAILLLMHIYVVSRLTIINNMNDTLWAFLYKFSGFHFLDLGVKRPYHRIGACLVS